MHKTDKTLFKLDKVFRLTTCRHLVYRRMHHTGNSANLILARRPAVPFGVVYALEAPTSGPPLVAGSPRLAILARRPGRDRSRISRSGYFARYCSYPLRSAGSCYVAVLLDPGVRRRRHRRGRVTKSGHRVRRSRHSAARSLRREGRGPTPSPSVPPSASTKRIIATGSPSPGRLGMHRDRAPRYPVASSCDPARRLPHERDNEPSQCFRGSKPFETEGAQCLLQRPFITARLGREIP